MRRNFNSQPHKEADVKNAVDVLLNEHFNSQPHKEADVDIFFNVMYYNIFQLTASQGGWLWREKQRMTVTYISTHSLTRRLTSVKNTMIMLFVFQLTASQGGWQSLFPFCLSHYIFQLTASQGGWLAGYVIHDNSLIISTHSLTRRLTYTRTGITVLEDISTHSLTRRLTCRTSEKGRCGSISTHSLTRRLTQNLHLTGKN